MLVNSSSLPHLNDECNSYHTNFEESSNGRTRLSGSAYDLSFEQCSGTSYATTPLVDMKESYFDSSEKREVNEKVAARPTSISSQFSAENLPHAILHNVGKTLNRTHIHLRRTRFLHVFYLITLLIYTLLGALLFQALDDEHDDSVIELYNSRCQLDRENNMEQLRNLCRTSPDECYSKMVNYLNIVEMCYRNWQDENRETFHPLSDLSNAIVYAFSVYSTIGYGTMSAHTTACRIATLIYGVIGIPLFFAFIKEEGNLFRVYFIRLYRYVENLFRSSHYGIASKNPSNPDRLNQLEKGHSDNENVAILIEGSLNPPIIYHKQRSAFSNSADILYYDAKEAYSAVGEQRRVFLASLFVFCAYLLAISGLFAFMCQWDFFTAFYFLFISVALIGFGDVFPSNPKVVLINAFFITLGIILFSMCYFILQEEIRVKAFQASKRARKSISKYSHSIMQHTLSPWSRHSSAGFDANHGPSSHSSFDSERKRRQSAPAVTLKVPTPKSRRCL